MFVESAFKHGYTEEDFFEVLEMRPMKLRSKRGLASVYELYGQNCAGEYLHIAYRCEPQREVIFHMREMSTREKKWYRSL